MLPTPMAASSANAHTRLENRFALIIDFMSFSFLFSYLVSRPEDKCPRSAQVLRKQLRCVAHLQCSVGEQRAGFFNCELHVGEHGCPKEKLDQFGRSLEGNSGGGADDRVTARLVNRRAEELYCLQSRRERVGHRRRLGSRRTDITVFGAECHGSTPVVHHDVARIGSWGNSN